MWRIVKIGCICPRPWQVQNTQSGVPVASFATRSQAEGYLLLLLSGTRVRPGRMSGWMLATANLDNRPR